MSKRMSRYPSDRKVYVGDLGNNARKNDLEYTFNSYGSLRGVWIARNPPGFAFIEFEHARDAADAVRGLNGRTICGRRVRVELSTGRQRDKVREDRRRDHSRNDRSNMLTCYDCGSKGHISKNCRRYDRYKRRSYSRSSRSRSKSITRSRSRSNISTRDKYQERNSRERSKVIDRGVNGNRYSHDNDGASDSHDSVSSKRRYGSHRDGSTSSSQKLAKRKRSSSRSSFCKDER